MMTCEPLLIHHSSFRIQNFFRPAPRVGDVERGGTAEARRVGAFERGAEIREALAAHETHRGAAEAPARHARAEHSSDAPRRLREHVQLRTAHLVVVAQGLVREAHQAADLFQVSAPQRVGGGERARVLRDDVAAAPPHDLGKLRGVALELPDAHVPQLLRAGDEAAQEAHALLALGAARVVLRARKLVLVVRVLYRHADLRGVERDGRGFERAAVYQERVPLPPERGDELVHDAAHRPDVCVLGLLPRERERDAVDLRARDRGEREPRRDFERGRRGEPRPLGHVRDEHQVRATQARAPALQRARHALDVVQPEAAARLARAVEVEGEGLAAVERVDVDQAVFARGGGDERRAVYRHRQDEAAVVVRVLAYEVDAAGRAEAAARAPVALGESAHESFKRLQDGAPFRFLFMTLSISQSEALPVSESCRGLYRNSSTDTDRSGAVTAPPGPTFPSSRRSATAPGAVKLFEPGGEDS